MAKGQLSLEALLSVSALLAAIALLALSATRIADDMKGSVLRSGERYSLSYEALCTDEAAGSLSGSFFAHSLAGVPSQGGKWLASREAPSVREPLFHPVSSSSFGVAYVQQDEAEPV